MKNSIFYLIFLSFLIISCKEPCNESECKGSSALFSFRLVDENLNDKVYGAFAEIDPDSIFIYGSNKGAISKLKKELTIKNFDTIPVFQFSVDFIHTRYIIETRTADTVISDTLTTSYILDNSECCNIELIEFNANLNSDELCVACLPEDVYLLNR